MKTDYEEWRSVKGFEDRYSVSSMGRLMGLVVKNQSGEFPARRIIKCAKYNGYVRTELSRNRTKRRVAVHRLVAEAFIPNPLNKPFVNHKNGVKHDNRPDNLEWVTKSENQRHAVLTGLVRPRRGQDGPGSKLTEEDVLDIRFLRFAGASTYRIAKLFNVSDGLIWKICMRQKWAHI